MSHLGETGFSMHLTTLLLSWENKFQRLTKREKEEERKKNEGGKLQKVRRVKKIDPNYNEASLQGISAGEIQGSMKQLKLSC